MTYRCGIGRGMEKFGLTPGPPHITCDGCGVTLSARGKGGCAPKWLLDQKAPRGWRLIIPEDGLRIDYCPKCKDKSL